MAAPASPSEKRLYSNRSDRKCQTILRQKTPPKVLDSQRVCGIISVEKGTADRRLVPPIVTRSNRLLGRRGGYFLHSSFLAVEQRNERNDEHSELKQFRPCNHMRHPLSVVRGQTRSTYPLKKRGNNRLPLWQHPLLLQRSDYILTGMTGNVKCFYDRKPTKSP